MAEKEHGCGLPGAAKVAMAAPMCGAGGRWRRSMAAGIQWRPAGAVRI